MDFVHLNCFHLFSQVALFSSENPTLGPQGAQSPVVPRRTRRPRRISAPNAGTAPAARNVEDPSGGCPENRQSTMASGEHKLEQNMTTRRAPKL